MGSYLTSTELVMGLVGDSFRPLCIRVYGNAPEGDFAVVSMTRAEAQQLRDQLDRTLKEYDRLVAGK